MSNDTAQAKKKIDAHSQELMQEFFQHFREVSAASDKPQSIDTVFQGWAIQKISSLQLIILDLTQDIIDLKRATSKTSPTRRR